MTKYHAFPALEN